MRNGIFQTLPVLNPKQKVDTKSIVVFTKQLSTLIVAGLPLEKALRTLHNRLGPGTFKDAINEIAGEVGSGTDFSESLSRFPKIFPGFYVNMVRAGEISDRLQPILKCLSEFLDKNLQLRDRIKSALIYPAFVFLVATLILIMLMIFVIPAFTDMFSGLGKTFSLSTKILISTSEIIGKTWYLIFLIPIIIVALYKFLIRDPDRKFAIDRFKLYIPMVGGLIHELCIAGFSRTLGTLLSSGVPIADALRTASDTMANEFIARAVLQVRDSIREGGGLSRPMEDNWAFPPLAIKMIKISEERGELDKVLIQIADNFEEEVDVAISGFTSLLDPILIILIGLILGFIIISMFIPLFSLARLIG